MTDTNSTTETATNETTFGFKYEPIREGCDNVVAEARRIFREKENAHHVKVRTVTDGMRELLGWGAVADMTVGLFSTLAGERASFDAAREERDTAVAEARNKRTEALAADPFMKFVDTVVRNDYSAHIADTLLMMAPFTIDSLKELANKTDWCQDFEHAAQEAAQEDVIPATPTLKASCVVSYYDVPEKFGAQADEDWVMDYEVPAYVRLTDGDGDAYYTGNFAIESTITYRRVDSDS